MKLFFFTVLLFIIEKAGCAERIASADGLDLEPVGQGQGIESMRQLQEITEEKPSSWTSFIIKYMIV